MTPELAFISDVVMIVIILGYGIAVIWFRFAMLESRIKKLEAHIKKLEAAERGRREN